MKHCNLTLLLTSSVAMLAALGGEKPAGWPSHKYDFGRAGTPPAKGYVRVGIGDTYTAARSYGLIHSASARERGWRKRGIQADLDGNGRADVLVAFGPWAFGTPQNLVLMEAPAKGAK